VAPPAELPLTFDALTARAAALAAGPGRAVLGITGAPGAGKSTLAEALLANLPTAAHVPMDGFHLADVALRALGRHTLPEVRSVAGEHVGNARAAFELGAGGGRRS
jgi:pantothenate kinase